MSKEAAKDLKRDYVRLLRGPGLAAAALGGGIGSAVAIDRSMNSEAEHAARLLDVRKDSYRSSGELASAINYVYGDDQLAPVHVRAVGEVLSGRGGEFEDIILRTDAPGVASRVEQVLEKRPDLAQTLGLLETLHSSALVKGLAGGHTLEETYAADPANTAVPLLAGLAGGGGTAALINRFS